MTYDEVIAQLEQSQASHTLNVDKSWTQGRTLFGGLTSGLIYQAMAIRPMRSHRCQPSGGHDFCVIRSASSTRACASANP